MCKCGRERRRRNNNGKNANEGCRREEAAAFYLRSAGKFIIDV